jgi:hypothetical protein
MQGMPVSLCELLENRVLGFTVTYSVYRIE